MSQYVRDILPSLGWDVKRDASKELDVWVASKNTASGPVLWTDFDEILDGAYLTGIYDEHVVGSQDEEAQAWLEKA